MKKLPQYPVYIVEWKFRFYGDMSGHSEHEWLSLGASILLTLFRNESTVSANNWVGLQNSKFIRPTKLPIEYPVTIYIETKLQVLAVTWEITSQSYK
jgi:hypothetical protein